MSSARIAELATCTVDYVPSRHLLPRFVKEIVKPGDVVVGMGAGNISDFVPDFVAELRRPKNKKVLVAYGGDSAEREVSLHSGRAILDALQRKGYDVQLSDLSELLLKGGSTDRLSGTDRPDAVFLAVHGSRAEDGAIQGLLEMLHLPYTGSDIQTSAVTMDKRLTKSILSANGIRVPLGIAVKLGDKLDESKVPDGKVIVKPNAQGSTVGLFFIEDGAQLSDAVEKSLHYDSEVLIEEWVEGTEISVPVLCGEVLPAVEIAPRDGKYDFASKYEIGGAEEICPARISEELTARAQQIALKCSQIFGCRGASRTDMIISGDEIFVLEINTLPGMTQTSLLPKSAQAAGIEFDDLCERILNDAFQKAKTTGS